ncbi:MAG: antibiotic biosynthesis monooxygenase [Bacteroidia bacterium]|nr:antibiotic biosynthesis monooxygenase [Bacteroidia bacterium]
MNSVNTSALVVLVRYKAQAGKGEESILALSRLIEKVRQEPHFISIILHRDPADPSNILLYETWSDENYYKGDHMKTTHLLAFMQEARGLLAGPPEISMWKVEQEFQS